MTNDIISQRPIRPIRPKFHTSADIVKSVSTLCISFFAQRQKLHRHETNSMLQWCNFYANKLKIEAYSRPSEIGAVLAYLVLRLNRKAVSLTEIADICVEHPFDLAHLVYPISFQMDLSRSPAESDPTVQILLQDAHDFTKVVGMILVGTPSFTIAKCLIAARLAVMLQKEWSTISQPILVCSVYYLVYGVLKFDVLQLVHITNSLKVPLSVAESTSSILKERLITRSEKRIEEVIAFVVKSHSALRAKIHSKIRSSPLMNFVAIHAEQLIHMHELHLSRTCSQAPKPPSQPPVHVPFRKPSLLPSQTPSKAPTKKPTQSPSQTSARTPAQTPVQPSSPAPSRPLPAKTPTQSPSKDPPQDPSSSQVPHIARPNPILISRAPLPKVQKAKSE